MSDLTGTGQLVRLILRRDRIRIVVWVGSLVSMVGVTVMAVAGLFPTQADLDAAAAASDNPAVVAFNGPAQGLDTLGGQVAFQLGAPGFVIAALMAVLMTARLTRHEEEAGRFELVRSLAVGRHAPIASAGIVVGAMSVLTGLLTFVVLVVQSLPVPGSLSFAVAMALVGLVFAAVTLVTAQITDNARLATGLAGCALGAAFLLRAVGDIGSGALSWGSPIGWVQKARPYAGERWWPFVLPLVSVAVLVAVARALTDRRDLGAGLIAPRPGRRHATPQLAGPFALQVRLQRGTVIGWTVGAAVMAGAYGSIINSIEAFVRDNPTMADLLVGSTNGSLVDAYLATSVRMIALIVGGFSLQSILRIRAEETELRAEPVLAGAVSRTTWACSHLAVAFLGTVVVLAVSGITLGTTAAIATGRTAAIPEATIAALAYTPANTLVIGLALVLIGFRPKAAPLVWTVLVGAFVVAFLGPVLDLPRVVEQLSPYDHVPLLPAATAAATAAPLATLTTIAAGLLLVGVVGLQHRDVG